jgi:hypothetical protein
MDGELAGLGRFPFLPHGAVLREMPRSTPLFRGHRAYATAFKVIVAHFQAYRVMVDSEGLLMRAKSLPVLYEWWCVLEVLRGLQGCLRLCEGQTFERGSPFRRMQAERDRLLIDFAPDQAVDFEDDRGRLVRMRYVPSYRGIRASQGLAYGLLGPEDERTPDIAVEVFPAGQRGSPVPELLIVMDAKYSSAPHGQKLEEVHRKYGKIGVFKTGRLLSRQVWALAPSAAAGWRHDGMELAAFCTVDNWAFWSDQFDMSSPVAGVVQAKPDLQPGRRPLAELLRLLLRRSGVVLRE